jgi:hypothetical protein
MIEIDETIAGHLKRYEALFQEQNGEGTVIFECHTPQDALKLATGAGKTTVMAMIIASSSWLSAKRGSRVMKASSRRGPGGTRPTGGSPWRRPRRMLEIQSGVPEIYRRAPSGPFVSARTHKSSLLRTASSRSAYHPVATGERTLRKVRVAPTRDIVVAERCGPQAALSRPNKIVSISL